MSLFSSQGQARLNVGFLLVDGFTLGAFANFVDVLRLSADEDDGSRQINCSWRILGRTSAPVKSSCGVSIQPDYRSFEPDSFDYLVLVGGVLRNKAGLDPWQIEYLRRAAASGVPLAALCTGVFHLTAAGLMKGYKCCVSWFHHQDFLDQFEKTVPVSDQLYVVDRDRLTCSGGVGSAHLAALLVNRHIGVAAAKKSLSIMMIDQVFGEDVPQPQSDLNMEINDPLVRKAIHFMRQRMNSPPTTPEIAARLGISRRQLERRFQIALGSSPARVCRSLRLRHGALVLARGHRSLSDIAEETGFCDASHFIRSYRNEFGHPPASQAGLQHSPP
ncbi:MAG: GlxA family transcriptional regulator [Hyphomonadaceae bacterium]|nr:GlxA family transcriptional regulator [Hyphomonadaceae bacterium]